MTRLYEDAREDLRIDGARAARHFWMALRRTARALDAWLWVGRDLVLGFLRLLIFLVAWADAQLREQQRGAKVACYQPVLVAVPETRFLRRKAVQP